MILLVGLSVVNVVYYPEHGDSIMVASDDLLVAFIDSKTATMNKKILTTKMNASTLIIAMKT